MALSFLVQSSRVTATTMECFSSGDTVVAFTSDAFCCAIDLDEGNEPVLKGRCCDFQMNDLSFNSIHARSASDLVPDFTYFIPTEVQGKFPGYTNIQEINEGLDQPPERNCSPLHKRICVYRL